VRLRTELKTHPDEWVNLPETYIRVLMAALADEGVAMPEAWMDPRGPRDATILLDLPGRSRQALVWDEETGLRVGEFVAGRQGIRTELAETAYLGGGLLPTPREAVQRLLHGTFVPKTTYRLHTAVRDGLDDHLRSR
jgi:uncharacterized protein DUF6292